MLAGETFSVRSTDFFRRRRRRFRKREASAENVRKIIGIIDVTWKISSKCARACCSGESEESDTDAGEALMARLSPGEATFNKDVKAQSPCDRFREAIASPLIVFRRGGVTIIEEFD